MAAIQERVQELEDFRLWAQELRNERIQQRVEPPWIRLWDGNWHYRGVLASEISGNVSLPLNDTEKLTLTLPIDLDDERGTFLAFWILEEEERGTRNVHVTIDKDGARVGGRMRKATLMRGEKDVVVVEFAGDMEELKNVHVAPSPFLPLSVIQIPKIWFLWCPAIYGLKLTLAVNLWRLSLTNFNLNADPLNSAGWGAGLWADAQIVVKPGALGADISPPTIITGAMQSWWDIAAPVCEDAELMIVTRRWLTGDPPAWPGAPALRNGTLVVDIVDKSGFRTGTSMGGNLATGLARAIADVTTGNVEDSYDLFTGTPIVDTSQYRVPNWIGTLKEHPYVVYRDGEVTGIQQTEFSRVPGGACRITAGGRSMPGVNELLRAGVNYAADLLGDNIIIPGLGFGIGSLGGALNSFLEPIYKDCLLPYMSVPLILRAAEQGWGHYLETVATGVMQAYTPAAIMALRSRRRETDPDTSFTLQIADASPWLIGDQGQGHWWLGDRVGATVKYLGARVFVQRCRQLDLAWGEGKAPQWQATFGDPRANQDPLDKLIALVSKAFTGLQQIGVWG